ncbi:MAG: radical SAM protein [Candidatus Bathyarchaeia archaeon]
MPARVFLVRVHVPVEELDKMSWKNKLLRKSVVPAGRYTYRGTGEFTGMALQLRVESDERGVMVINANTVLHLNPTASAYAYFFMQGMPEAEVIKKIRGTFRVDENQAKADYERLIYTISTLAETEKICPVTFLDVEKEEPFSYAYTAPLRMDMALTFRCQNNCIHCYAGGPHETAEMTTAQWKQAIDHLSSIGVFILTFTGGEPTLREDLPELLLYAQNKGMVTGLITNGRNLQDKAYVDALEKAGLDFVQVTLESHKPEVHDAMTASAGSWKETVAGIRNVVNSQIYVTTNTTLSKHNAKSFLDTVDFIKGLGVDAFGCNSLIYSGKANEVSQQFALTIDDLHVLLPQVRDKAQELGLKFLWYTPTQYCQFDPVQYGLGVKSCSAALINMCVAPNGEVYPCQSYFESLGNILTASWSKIWNHPTAQAIRSRAYAPEKCEGCPQLQVCGGGCPLELQNEKALNGKSA